MCNFRPENKREEDYFPCRKFTYPAILFSPLLVLLTSRSLSFCYLVSILVCLSSGRLFFLFHCPLFLLTYFAVGFLPSCLLVLLTSCRFILSSRCSLIFFSMLFVLIQIFSKRLNTKILFNRVIVTQRILYVNLYKKT